MGSEVTQFRASQYCFEGKLVSCKASGEGVGMKQDAQTCEIFGYKVCQQDDNKNCFNILHSCGLYIYKLITPLARTDNKLHYAAVITVTTAHLMEILLYLVI